MVITKPRLQINSIVGLQSHVVISGMFWNALKSKGTSKSMKKTKETRHQANVMFIFAFAILSVCDVIEW